MCASLLIASGASDVQVAHQMGHSKIETTKNIYGHLFAQDRALILDAMNQAVSRWLPAWLPGRQRGAPGPAARRGFQVSIVATFCTVGGGPAVGSAP